MTLYGLHQKAQDLLSMFTSRDEAGRYQDAQKNAIKELRTTEWYKHIVQYLELEAEEALQKLRDWKTPPSDTPNYRAQANVCIKLLDWLDYMTKS